MKQKQTRKPKQSIPKGQRYTFEDFNKEFPDNDSCLEYIKEERFPDGINYCHKCDTDRKHHRVRGRTAYACDYCGNHIYPLAGTIFEKTTTPLRSWFYAMFLMSSRCGVSAKQLQREIGVTYKTAWRMFKQIRQLFSEEDLQLEGSSVEVDETYFGGKRKKGVGRPMRGDKKKTPILGMVERQGRVVAQVVDDVSAKTLCSTVQKYVLSRSTVYTDELNSYNKISPARGYYEHRRIHHSSKVYVMGDIHTNTIEGFWSLLKRGIGGVYHSVSQKYLQTYLDEYSFRYNRRNADQPMFILMLKQVSQLAD